MYIETELIKKWKPKVVVVKKLLEKWVDKSIINQVISDLEEQIQDGQIEKIQKEIVKLKQRWKNGFDIIQALMRRGYSLSLIKKAINKLEKEE
jgi:SOS response regulatory protein OraA/RecX